MRPNHEQESIKTTLGDLVVAVSDAAFELYQDERGAYLLAGLALEAILKRAPLRTSKMAEVKLEPSPEEMHFH